MAYRAGSSVLAGSPAEIARRNGIDPALATSREARAAVPVPSPPPATLKGAVRVAGFPSKSIYPFDQIAADGGVWKIDPAAFTWRGKPTKPASVYTAARKYATEHGLTVKIVADGGMVYVQFKAGE